MTQAALSRFSEQIASSVRGDIDEDVGVVRNVRILGRESSNGRTYSDAAMRQAAKLYEGVSVNLDHSTSERKFSEGFGELASVRVREGEVRGDLHYLKSHPQAAVFVEAAKRFPRSFGLSHDAEGSVVREGDKNVVESIERVYSVDIVSRPATNAGLFESQSENKTVKKTIGQLLEANKDDETAAMLATNIKEMDDIGDISVDVEDGADSDSQIKAAFSGAAAAVFDDTSLSSSDALAKIRKLLKARDTVTGDGGDGGNNKPPEEMGEGDGMNESEKRLRQELDQLKEERARDKAEAAARKMLEAESVEATDVRIAAVVRCESEEERRSLIEDLPRRHPQRSDRPESSPPKFNLNESDEDTGKSYSEIRESSTALFGSRK